MSKVITMALAKGRLAEKTVEILEQCSIDCSQIRAGGRKLVLTDSTGMYRFILVKPSDVPTYVERGVADIGVVGKDTLMESGTSVYEMLDLGFAKCKLSIAGYEGRSERPITSYNLRVATKYPSIAKSFYAGKGISIDIIKLNGSVELGPLVGLSDVILDIVESGKTLKENGLSVLEDICQISARLIVNRVSLKTKGDVIKPLLEDIDNVLSGGEV